MVMPDCPANADRMGSTTRGLVGKAGRVVSPVKGA